MPRTLLIALFALAFLAFSNSKLTAVDKKPAGSEVKPVSLLVGKRHKAKLLTRVNFEDSLKQLYDKINLSAYNLPYDIFRLGMIGYYSLEKEGSLSDKGLISIIDFSKPSTEKRFYTIDLKNQILKYHTYVAHGRNTGANMASEFSNIPHSNQSSLGFYVTAETYVGSKGYSLRLDGKEKSFNDKIRSRTVVMHAADYATESWIKCYGRLGRSQGCPALPPKISKEVIDVIKNKTAIFTYYPDRHYLNASRYLKVEDLFEKLDRAPVQIAASEEGRQS
ncbi:MAG: murein L,D-transpeptidase catalytic domain family protein [Cyclobacteriaceae bacterium]